VAKFINWLKKLWDPVAEFRVKPVEIENHGTWVTSYRWVRGRLVKLSTWKEW
jgi:hypothetical protein